MKILGIDEAGRGPVVGPMVMAGVLLDKRNEDQLKSLGVKDSKDVSPAKRQDLFHRIYEIAEEVHYVIIGANEIDKLRTFMTLNEIEALRASDVIESFSMPSEIIYVDSPDPNESYFSERINRYLNDEVTIKSEHFADRNYVSVSAASIIAKVIRDQEVKKIESKYGIIGSGYPHDRCTIDFLEKWYQEMKEWPSCVRKSWDTVRVIEEKFHQLRIVDF
jgi:ribonuclease HII